MKKIIVITALLISTLAVTSQNIINVKEAGIKTPLFNNYNVNPSKTPTDTICLDDFFNIGQPSIYGDYFGYTFGTSWDSASNPQSPEIAQGFLMTFTGGYNIEEALIWTGAKDKSSTSSGSSIDVKITKIDGTSSYGPGGTGTYSIDCPNTVLGSATVLWDDIDTSDFTIVQFATPVYVTTDYAITVNFDNFYTNGDTIGIVCSEQGGGSAINGIEYTWWKYRPSTGNSFWAELSHIFTVSGSPIDVCYAIFPVVNASTGIVDGSDNFINGLQLGQNSPNPAFSKTSIPYAVNETSNIILEIYDIKGNLIMTIDEGTRTSGRYSIELNNKLASGVYYYSLVSGKNRLTKKMVFSK
jgi:hypothetical protein